MSSVPILRSQSFHVVPSHSQDRALRDSSGNAQHMRNPWQDEKGQSSDLSCHGPPYSVHSQSDRLRHKKQQQGLRRQRKEDGRHAPSEGRYIGDFLEQENFLERGGSLEEVIKNRTPYENELAIQIETALRRLPPSKKSEGEAEELEEEGCGINHSGSAYLQYRARNREKAVDKQTWPDAVEDVFIRALYVYQPIGKRKMTNYTTLETKGRNELIAGFIKKETGVSMPRKRISSHIQVLRGHLKHNVLFMSLIVSCDDTENDFKGSKAPIRRALSQRSNSHFNRSIVSQKMSLRSSKGGEGQTHGTEPTLFAIWIQPDKPELDNRLEHSLHTYTPAARYPIKNAHISLDSIADWRSKFPRLAEIKGQGAIECDLIRLSTSLKLPTSAPPELAKLVPSFEIMAASDGLEHCGIKCRTTIYRNSNQVYSLEQEADIQISNGTAKMHPPFLAKFWAEFFSGLDESRKRWAENGLDAEAEASLKISKLTAMQEIVAYPVSKHVNAHTVAICLWEFDMAVQDDKRYTIWNRVNVPQHSLGSTAVSRSDVFEPEVSMPQPMSLASVSSPSFQVQSSLPATDSGWIDQCQQPWNSSSGEAWNQSLLIQPLMHPPQGSAGNTPAAESFDYSADSESQSVEQQCDFDPMHTDQMRFAFADFESIPEVHEPMPGTGYPERRYQQQGMPRVQDLGIVDQITGNAEGTCDQHLATPLDPRPFNHYFYPGQNVPHDSGYPSTVTDYLSPAEMTEDQKFSGFEKYGEIQWPVPEREMEFAAHQSFGGS